MKLALALSLKQKPLATCPIGNDGYYPQAVVEAVNASRLYLHAQMLLDAASYGQERDRDRYLERTLSDIKALELKKGELKAVVTIIDTYRARIDVYCKK